MCTLVRSVTCVPHMHKHCPAHRMRSSCSPCQVLVLENCLGLVTAAAVERMGGVGHLCAGQLDKQGPLDAVKLMNLTHEQEGVLFVAPVTALLEAQQVWGAEVVAMGSVSLRDGDAWTGNA